MCNQISFKISMFIATMSASMTVAAASDIDGAYARFSLSQTSGVIEQTSVPPSGVAATKDLGGAGTGYLIGAGYDHYLKEDWLVGAFVDIGNNRSEYSWSNRSHEVTLSSEVDVDLGLRLGLLATPDHAVYLTGGYSWSKYNAYSSGFGSGALNEDIASSGLFAGAGFDYAISEKFDIRAEYRYREMGSLPEFKISPSSDFRNWKPRLHTINIGLNWRPGRKTLPQSNSDSVEYLSSISPYIALSGGALTNKTLWSSNGGSGSDEDRAAQGLLGDVTIGLDAPISQQYFVGGNLSFGASSINSEHEFKSSSPGFNLKFGDTYSIGARVGRKTPKGLIYATTGLALSSYKTLLGDEVQNENAMVGYFAGVGTEIAISKNASLQMEYRYNNFGIDEISGTSPKQSLNTQGQQIKLGFVLRR